jgi:hypothetical protein
MRARGFGAYIGRWYASGYGDRDLCLSTWRHYSSATVVRSLPLTSTVPAKLLALADAVIE